MDPQPEDQHQKYHLSVNNLTNKQPSVVSVEKHENFEKSIIYFHLQYKTIDISKDLIVYGTEKSTGALFIYRRNPYTFFKAIPGNVIRGMQSRP